MKPNRSVLLPWILLLAIVPGCAGATEEDSEMAKSRKLQAGDVAPPFELPGSDGRTYRLEEYSGEKVVVVAWFPKAFTGG
jgi:peroxiredoxin Q/BCP